MKNTILEQVQQIGADIFNVGLEEMSAEASPATIESWDSLQHLSLVLALEESFGLELAPEEMEQMQSVQIIVALVEKRLRSAA
jgi:acyl carrier protein